MLLAILIIFAAVTVLPLFGLIVYACYRGVKDEWDEYGLEMFKIW